jgi:sodium/hydrogen antiporter
VVHDRQQLGGDGVKIDLVAQPGAEGVDRPGGVVLAPVESPVLIAIAYADLGGRAEWLGFLGQPLVLGPAAGFAVGAAGSWVMGWVDERFHIRPEYQSLYGIGLVLGAFVTGEAAGGDGFLAASAGLAVTAFKQTLCNCFLEFGQVIAETTMLVAFVLFGAVLYVSLLAPG